MLKKVLPVLLFITLIVGCSKSIPENALVSRSIKEAPVLDGVVDDLWTKAKPLTVEVKVPSYSEFDKVYHGKEYSVSMKSLYTDSDIYFLYQWSGDLEASYKRQTWYFNPTEGRWMQKPKKNSDEYSKPVYEDKFAVIWNIGNSIGGFNEQGCLVLCHGEFKHTNIEGETGDIWHWKLDRTGPVNQLDDKWLTYSTESGRKADEGTSAYKSNSQSLTDINGNKIKAPLYWIPGKMNYHWILGGDTSSKRIVKIDAAMNLIDEDGTVIPRDVTIPSLYNIVPATGSRGDVTVFHNYQDGIWTLEVKRKLSTGNKDDVDFSDTKKIYFFSVAVFNEAAIAHAIPGFAGNSFPMVFK